jgi:transposase
VALAAIKGDRTLAQLSEQYDVHVNQIVTWKDQFLERAAEVFERAAGGKPSAPPVDVNRALGPHLTTLTADIRFIARRTAHRLFGGEMPRKCGNTFCVGKCIPRDRGDQWPTQYRLKPCRS